MKGRKIVPMRNILTEKRQWCKVNTDKKAGFTHKKQGYVLFFRRNALHTKYFVAKRLPEFIGADHLEKAIRTGCVNFSLGVANRKGKRARFFCGFFS